MKRFRVYLQKVDDFSAEMSYEDDDISHIEGDELIAAVASDAADMGLGDWDFIEGNTIALSVVEINEDGSEGESHDLDQVV